MNMLDKPQLSIGEEAYNEAKEDVAMEKKGLIKKALVHCMKKVNGCKRTISEAERCIKKYTEDIKDIKENGLESKHFQEGPLMRV